MTSRRASSRKVSPYWGVRCAAKPKQRRARRSPGYRGRTWVWRLHAGGVQIKVTHSFDNVTAGDTAGFTLQQWDGTEIAASSDTRAPTPARP